MEGIWIYIGHLHSLHGEFKTVSQDQKEFLYTKFSLFSYSRFIRIINYIE